MKGRQNVLRGVARLRSPGWRRQRHQVEDLCAKTATGGLPEKSGQAGPQAGKHPQKWEIQWIHKKSFRNQEARLAERIRCHWVWVIRDFAGRKSWRSNDRIHIHLSPESERLF